MSMKVTKEQFIGVTYEELLALNDELLAFNDELLAENEHMRLKDMAVMGELQEENELLQEENAKLRGLVRFIMHQCNDGNPRCDKCIGWNDGECVALLRMRELGVGV